jgi:hypothetical protein
MANKTPISSIYEFHDELATLLMRCDLHTPDIASVLVSNAVALAAADGCDSELQRTSIEKFAANAIVKLRSFSQSAGIVH